MRYQQWVLNVVYWIYSHRRPCVVKSRGSRGELPPPTPKLMTFHVLYRVAQKSKPLSRIIITSYYKPPLRRHFSSILSITWAQECFASVLNILRVTYFLTSITMLTYKVAICVTYGKWCERSLWHQLDLGVPFLNHLLDGDLCRKISLISTFSLIFSGFQSWFCHMRWFYPCRNFKHSNWWRRKLGRT